MHTRTSVSLASSCESAENVLHFSSFITIITYFTTVMGLRLFPRKFPRTFCSIHSFSLANNPLLLGVPLAVYKKF